MSKTLVEHVIENSFERGAMIPFRTKHYLSGELQRREGERRNPRPTMQTERAVVLRKLRLDQERALRRINELESMMEIGNNLIAAGTDREFLERELRRRIATYRQHWQRRRKAKDAEAS